MSITLNKKSLDVKPMELQPGSIGYTKSFFLHEFYKDQIDSGLSTKAAESLRDALENFEQITATAQPAYIAVLKQRLAANGGALQNTLMALLEAEGVHFPEAPADDAPDEVFEEYAVLCEEIDWHLIRLASGLNNLKWILVQNCS